MKLSLRGLVALFSAAVLLMSTASAQDKNVLTTERDKVSYMVGADVGRSITPAGPDLDMAAFEKAIRNAFAGGKPLVSDEEARSIGQSVMARIAARSGQPQQGTPPEVAKDKVGLLIGTDIGRSLAPIKDEIDLAVFLQAVRNTLDKRPSLLSDAEANTVRQAFFERLKKDQEAKSAAASQEADAQMQKNKTTKGVITTASGLQYMVLRQGSGPRPKATDTVRVNYEGKLLDGKVFDSSYARNSPATFPLNQVIAGWTEGVALMAVGAKYRFWVPAELAYGARGTPDGSIGPNMPLTFDVELLEIVAP